MPTMLNKAAVANPTRLPTHHPSELPMVAPTKASSRDKSSYRPPAGPKKRIMA